MGKFQENYFEVANRAMKEYYLEQKIRSSIVGNLPFLERYSKMYEKVLYRDIWKNFNGCNRVLEIGFGNGEFLQYAPNGLDIVGTDIINKQINHARKKGFKVMKADCRKLPFKPESFDGVYCAHVLEHMNDIRIVLEQFRRVLKQDGVLILRTPNFANTIKHFYDDPTHITPITKMRLIRLLEELNFRDIKITGGYCPNYSYDNLVYIFLYPFFFFPNIKLKLVKIISNVNEHELLVSCKK